MSKEHVLALGRCRLLIPALLVCGLILAHRVKPSAVRGEPIARTEREASEDKLSGLWHGVYHNPEGSGLEPVKFQAVLTGDGKTVVGFMKEPNTFGNAGEPWLQAACKGQFDARTAKLTLTKTYDGSAGVSHDVQYTGDLSKDRTKIEGSWTIGDVGGRFVLERQKLDDAALETLK